MNKEFVASYLELFKTKELELRLEQLYGLLGECRVCPRECEVNRLEGEIGCCGIGRMARLSSCGPHYGEEAPLRGWRGSGTIFFGGCNLGCVYCQNADISQHPQGRKVDPQELGRIMLDLQKAGCHNINLVSPSHLVPQIIAGLIYAADHGLKLPLVYNTGGYDSLQVIKLLDGIVDIYMPDMKYSDRVVGKKYSGVPDYPRINQLAVAEMHRQVGDLVLSNHGIALRGVIIRHLILPENLAGSHSILDFIAREISKNTYLNLMDQYRPAYLAGDYPELSGRVGEEQYRDLVETAKELGLNRLDGVTKD